jgi:cell division protease FtsH
MVMRLPERDSYSYHRDKMYANLAVAMGGRVAEEVIFGYDKVSSGASGDIQYATGLARDMVTKWGMSDRVGPVEYAQPEGESFLGYSSSQPVRMSNQTAQLIDDEIKAIVEGGLARAKQLLGDHIDQLHTVAGALLEFETLTGDEIKRLVAGEDIGRPDPGAATRSVPSAGTSIPKTRRPQGPFGNPAPAGA